jgi:large subunit ribosomal protein L19
MAEKNYEKKELPKFSVGDQVKVYVKIQEEGKTRTQVFEGIVISKKEKGLRSTFTVRRISYGEGVERIFLAHSPFVENVEIVKKGRVRRSKLYYLRKKVGKKGKVKEKIEKS